MKNTLKISLKPNEKIYLNGAVIRVDRKVTLELLNDVQFLLESHVLQIEEASTPLRQLYFILQVMLMNPSGAHEAYEMFRRSLPLMLASFEDEEIRGTLKQVDRMVGEGHVYEALKAIRSLYPLERRVLGENDDVAGARAADGGRRKLPMNIDLSPPARTDRRPPTAEAASKTEVDYQSFLKLLVAQMKNQDPTNPMDSTQYIAQLAAFSQVEQSVQINSKLDQMLQSSTLAQADSLIGRTVTSADGKITGKVEEVRLITNGIVAVLEGGKEIAVGSGRRHHPAGRRMNEADALDIVQFAIWTVLTAAAPPSPWPCSSASASRWSRR